jgi:integrase
MSKGVKQDLRCIFPYQLADGSTRYQVRVRIPGRGRRSVSCDTLGEAIKQRNRLEETRIPPGRGEPAAEIPPAKKRGGSKARRTVVDFIRDEWWPTIKPTDPSQPTRGRAKGKAGAKQMPLADRTRANYQGLLYNWIHKTALGGLDPAKVDAQHITEWMAEIRARGASDAVIRQALKLLSNAFGWAATMPRATGIHGNPVTSAAWPAEVRLKEPQYFDFETTEWIRQWILHTAVESAGLDREARSMLFCLMAGTGMRPEEARRVEVAHIHEHFVVLPARISKTGRERIIPWWRPSFEDVSAYVKKRKLKPGDPLIPGPGNGAMSFAGWENWRRNAYIPARNWVALEIVHDKRLAWPREDGSKRRPLGASAYDVCRHRYARAQLAALVPPQEVADAMGHDLSTLARVYAGPIREATELRRRGAEPYDPEAELARARELVESKLPAELKRWRAERTK